MMPPPGFLEKVAEDLAGEASAHLLTVTQGEPLNEVQLWHLLAVCVLSSQVPYGTAVGAANALTDAGFPWQGRELEGGKLRSLIENVLRLPLPQTHRRYRFPVTRAKWLAAGNECVTSQFGSLAALLSSDRDIFQLRRLLIASVPGMGPKQASMFLRDSRTSMDVAVIDRHILRFMNIVGGWQLSTSALSTASKYEKYEELLRSYTGPWSVSLGAADLAIWAAVRAAAAVRVQ